MSVALTTFNRHSAARAVGPVNARIVIVTDQPNRNDAELGQCISGDALEVFNRILTEAGINTSQCLYMPCSTMPKMFGDKLTPEQFQTNFNQFVKPVIQEYPRDLVIILGNNAICATGINDKPEKINSFRGKLLEIQDVDAPCIATIHPWILIRNPDDNYIETLGDLKIGKRYSVGNFDEQVPIKIERLETLQDLDDFYDYLEHWIDNGGEYIYYDIETTGLDPYKDIPVSIGFTLLQTDILDGAYISYVWSSHDRLVPRYTENEIEAFKETFKDIFLIIGAKFVGQNSISFDDWMIAEWLKMPELLGNLSCEDTMYNRWVINKAGSKGLKENTETYLGYSNYDGKIKDAVSEIAKRRGKVMYKSDPTTADDFRTLEWYGIEPIETAYNAKKGQGYKWPDKEILDKKAAAYALVELDDLELYLGYDCVYTGLLHLEYHKEIDADPALVQSNELRHRFGKSLIKAEKRGFYLDEETNSDFNKKLTEIIKESEKKIEDAVYELDPTVENFNPGSTQQLSKILFGEPSVIPLIDPNSLYDYFDDLYSVNQSIDTLHENFYGNYDSIRDLEKSGTYDYLYIQSKLLEQFNKNFGSDYNPKIIYTKKYLNGIYAPEPDKCSKKTGQPSVGATILKELYNKEPHELLRYILMYSKAKKMFSTFVSAFPKYVKSDGRVHPQIRVTGTKSGRPSGRNFNSLNLVKYMRGQFIAPEGYDIVTWDLSGAEARVVAAHADDQALMEAIYSSDFHSATAAMILGIPIEQVNQVQRHQFKTLNFALIYKASAFKIAIMLGISTDEAQKLMDMYLGRFEKLNEWMDNQVIIAKQPPHYVETVFGTRCYLYDILSSDRGIAGHAERIAVNMPIQGSAGELALLLCSEICDTIEKELGVDSGMFNTTYDSQSLYIPLHLVEQTKEIIRYTVEKKQPYGCLSRVDFKCDIENGPYWYGPPDLKKSLDPYWGTDKSTLPWHLLTVNTGELTTEEREEVSELDALENGE